MQTRDVIVVGASSGGFSALCEIVELLPDRFPASIFIVQHLAAESENRLPAILAKRTRLPVQVAVSGGLIEIGRIYFAPAKYHLVLDQGRTVLSRAPRENRVRPAIDPLFRSAALAYRNRVIGIVLSGSLDDGTSGLLAVKAQGGITIAQDPATAITPSMPQSAIDNVGPDYCAEPHEIAALLQKLTAAPLEAGQIPPSDANNDARLRREVDLMLNQSLDIATYIESGVPVPIGCPECGGPLREIDQPYSRFRCHTGHSYSARHLAAGLGEAEEQALWFALRITEERVRMLDRLARGEAERGREQNRQQFAASAAEAQEHAERLHELLGIARIAPADAAGR